MTKHNNTFADIGGVIVKEDERYTVKDDKTLKNLCISSTRLNPNMSTSGHSHEKQEECSDCYSDAQCSVSARRASTHPR